MAKSTLQPVVHAGASTMVPLSKLYLASEAPDNLDFAVRKAPDDPASFATLKASIVAIGVLVPLIVHRHKDKLFVVAGNRRLSALRDLANGLDISVPIIEAVGGAATEVRELAVMSNIALPMHPVDQFEVIAGAVKAGMSETDIGARWGLPQRRVRQIMAFGALAPEIRNAWRDGEINSKCAQAFTLGDKDAQVKAFNKLRKGAISDWQVKRDLVGSKADSGKLVAFVGIEEYRKAGGEVREDLFGIDHAVSDAKLLKKLADEKLAGVCEQLLRDGWKWAQDATANDYQFGRVGPTKQVKLTQEEAAELEAIGRAESSDEDEDTGENAWEAKQRIERARALRSYQPDERAKLGCFVSIDDAGRLQVDPGRVSPEEKRSGVAKERAAEKKKKAAKAAAAGEPLSTVSNALMQRMSEWLTEAASVALKEMPKRNVALAALIAGFNSDDKAVSVSERGLAGKKATGMPKQVKFVTAFYDALALPTPQQLLALDAIISRSLDFQVFHSDHKPLADDGVRALCDEISPPHMERALLKAFDADDYFESVSKPMCLGALREIGMRDEGIKALSTTAKAVLAKHVAKQARDHKWLPPELRTKHYAGPGTKPAAKSARKSARKKGAKR